MKNSQAEADLSLLQASEDGDLPKARRALALGAEVESTTMRDTSERITPLMLASKGGHASVVQLLLKTGAKVDRKTRSAIPGETSGETALHWAVCAGHGRVCRLLLDHGASTSVSSTRGNALAYAIESGDASVVRLLLSAGSDTNQPAGRKKLAPLYLAARRGNSKVVRALVEAGGVVRANEFSRETPLMAAAVGGFPDCFKWLLKAGDDVNAADRRGWTPLMWGAWGNHGESVRRLLKAGAQADRRDREGKTAMDLAKQIEAFEALFCIEKHLGTR